MFIMGKSASGKDHIYQSLLEDKDLKLGTVTLYTTRPMREGEVDGREYFFVDDKKASELEMAGKIIELRAYNTQLGIWKYFTVDDGQIDLESGQDYLVIGTLEAYEMYVKHYGKDQIVPIYIEVDDDIRLIRAIERERKQKNPRYDELARRFLADCDDFSEEKLAKNDLSRRFKNNTSLEECLASIKREVFGQAQC
jgi:guanylate kinase